MISTILENLNRQLKGLELLEQLQLEEFELLRKREAAAISSLEFSIHELIRQLAVEREDIRTVMQGTRLAEYANLLPEEDAARMRMLLQAIDYTEQRCAKQAEMNTTLSLALLDKSHEVMNYLYEQVQPVQHNVYGARGAYTTVRPQASILNGRL